MMDGVPLWAELKIAKGRTIALSSFQIGWHARHAACGGAAALVVGEAGVDALRIYRGSEAPAIAAAGLSAAAPLFSGDSPAEALEALRAYACEHLRQLLGLSG